MTPRGGPEGCRWKAKAGEKLRGKSGLDPLSVEYYGYNTHIQHRHNSTPMPSGRIVNSRLDAVHAYTPRASSDELAFLGLLRSSLLKKRSPKTKDRMDVILKAILRCMKHFYLAKFELLFNSLGIKKTEFKLDFYESKARELLLRVLPREDI